MRGYSSRAQSKYEEEEIMSDENHEPEDLDWDLEDRDARLASGELTAEVDDPTEVVVGEDD